MKDTTSGEPKATRQCWECLKRRLVCDHTLPHCKKCQKAGKECPGYDEQKPLQWVEPGKVTSRRRKKNSPPTIYTAPVREPKETAKPKKSKNHAKINELDDPETWHGLPLRSNTAKDWELHMLQLASRFPELDAPALDVIEYERAISLWPPPEDYEWDELIEDPEEQSIQIEASQVAKNIRAINKIFNLGTRDKIQEVVVRGDFKGAADMLKSERQPLERLERLLRLMKMHDLPNYDYLTNETNEVVQAVQYYNLRILPTVKAAGELAPNPAVILFPLRALHILPPAIHHTLVCLALNHYVHTLPIGADKSTAIENRSKVYRHRGAAIQALSHYVGKDKTRCNDLTIASILMFMSMELQNPAMADWRSHASGLRRIIDMRGGFRTLMKQSPHLAPTLVVYILIVVIANTCSPSWDQINLSDTPTASLSDIRDSYNLIFPYNLCPPALFFLTIRTNHLRARASAVLFAGEIDPGHALEAQDLLAEIEAFSPEDWAQPGASYDEWLCIGIVYQAAVALYTTMSLQSLTILPSSLEMNSMRSIHAARLVEALTEALKSPRLVNFLIWPLVVAGVEAGFGDDATRYWIGQQLSELSRRLGTSSPLKAQAVLRRYWAREEPGWDECFDRPYVFVI
ncbi:fungal-specific transcription factor domain-containing protein [Paraphoma chrysanthemicola]|uniref:Fungal-specific transcription factor domain-containing protein n=1 Tax=Paraphoma chrysanthemicola TaxID=798071 RepID=A0A8K0RF06_9PLEO|nr:fungal-specific transcription factor domain-containing protein [Paraphoma chrysanthemicola]